MFQGSESCIAKGLERDGMVYTLQRAKKLAFCTDVMSRNVVPCRKARCLSINYERLVLGVASGPKSGGM